MTIKLCFLNNGDCIAKIGRNFYHNFSDMQQLAQCIKEARESKTTKFWEGNEGSSIWIQYDYETDRNGGCKWMSVTDVRHTKDSGWSNICALKAYL